MKYLVALGVALVLWTRYPSYFEAGAVVAFIGFLVWAFKGNGQATAMSMGAGRAPRPKYGCGSCSFRSSTATRVAEHEAGHAVTGEALGYKVKKIGISDDGSGGTWFTRDMRGLPDKDALVTYVAGSIGEGEPYSRINGSSEWSDKVRSRVISKRMAAEQGGEPTAVLRAAQRQASAIIKARSGRHAQLTGLLLDALDSPEHGRHDGWWQP